ncbi:MAG: EAL domain-containing protein [Methylosarcina sp.]
MDNERFFSLRWKLVLLFGTVFLVLHSIFSYVSYLDAIDNFSLDRKNIENNHINILKTLTDDSFLVLEQFAELLPLMGELPNQPQKIKHHAFSNLDENWSRWQLSWDMESIVFFDNKAKRVKFWGNPQLSSEEAVKRVLRDEAPAHKLFCSDDCFLQVIVPVIGESECIGAFSVIRSFADVIIKYKSETNSDIGLLVPDKNHDLAKPGDHIWPFILTGLTLLEKNLPLYQYISKQYVLPELLAHSKTITFDGSVFEVRIIPVQHRIENNPPYFLLIDEITSEVGNLNEDLKQVWIYGVISLAASLILLTLVIHIALRRVGMLARALPLLSQSQYDHFRNQIINNDSYISGYDELDRLNQTALTLTDHLEYLEKEVRGNTLKLLEKSQELANERDFIRQLIEAAPIIILTQKLNGMILTINQAGIHNFEADSDSITGKVFDLYLPESDWEHLKKLNQLRTGSISGQILIDGMLVTDSGKQRNISWLHKLFKRGNSQDEPVILTLGVDNSERKLYEQAILSTSTKDHLTGLSNRRKFLEDLAALLASAQRYGYKAALFYLDLDQFKSVNANSGHEAGDKLLTLVANKLKDVVRSTDILCRLDGDEFALAVPYAETKGVKSIAEKIRQELAHLGFNFAGKDFELSASMGISIYPDHGLTVKELFINADFAMYQARTAGNGKYHVFSPDFDYQIKLNRMLYWRQTLENAIARDKFILLFQPIVHIETNVISHYECLIRLQLDNGQMVMPEDFILHAEELGLIGKIDRLVLKKAVQKLVELKRRGKDYKLTVNLSGRLLEDTALFDDISRLLDVPEVEPGKIIFEISETAVVSNFATAEALIMQIKALGCALALDDFGVGFSSFYYLKHFPVDYVKIDGSFIRKINKTDDDKVFVKALSGVAHAFGKKTVAKFAENEQILEVLREFEIDYAQGNYIGKPEQYI